jgi:hypothetical protein
MEQTALPGITEQLSLGLEFLVTAEVIRTDPGAHVYQYRNPGRSYCDPDLLSWSLAVAMEGRWPWQPKPVTDHEVTV